MLKVYLFSCLMLSAFFYFVSTETFERKISLHAYNNDPSVPEKNIEAYIDTWGIVCLQILADFNPNGLTDWNMTIDPTYLSSVKVFDGDITIGGNWSRSYPNDVDIVTWSIAKSVIPSAYPSNNSASRPTWITDNMFEYARYVFGVNNEAVNWSLGEFDFMKHINFTVGGKATSRFLVWLENHFPDIIQKVHQSFVYSLYTDYFWTTETNQTINELWNANTTNPTIFRPPVNKRLKIRDHYSENGFSSTILPTDSSITKLQEITATQLPLSTTTSSASRFLIIIGLICGGIFTIDLAASSNSDKDTKIRHFLDGEKMETSRATQI